MIKQNEIPIFALLSMVFVSLVACYQHYFFFYDTTQLGAMHGLFYYENNFNRLVPPVAFDSGHVPFFGIYLAAAWFIFGKSLAVSHWLMLPFMLGTCWQSIKLLRFFMANHLLPIIALVLLLEPTYLAQCSLISPDTILVFFFFLALNSILHQEHKLLAFASVGLFMISMRGLMCCFGLFLFQQYYQYRYLKSKFTLVDFVKLNSVYVPGFVIFLSYNVLHYLQAGWVLYHANSAWAGCFERVGIKAMLYNAGIVIWRCFDFGRIVFYIIGLPTLALYLFKNKKTNPTLSLLFVLACTMAITLCGTTLPYKSLSNHRYYLPLYFCIALFFSYLFHLYYQKKHLNFLFFIIGIGLLSGHLWSYPKGIAMGWDCTMAYTPYYKTIEKVEAYMQANGIDKKQVSSYFPIISNEKYTKLNDKDEALQDYAATKTEYVLYSNLCNDFNEADFEIFNKEFNIESMWASNALTFILYKRKE
jgi:hypothetical protein